MIKLERKKGIIITVLRASVLLVSTTTVAAFLASIQYNTVAGESGGWILCVSCIILASMNTETVKTRETLSGCLIMAFIAVVCLLGTLINLRALYLT